MTLLQNLPALAPNISMKPKRGSLKMTTEKVCVQNVKQRYLDLLHGEVCSMSVQFNIAFRTQKHVSKRIPFCILIWRLCTSSLPRYPLLTTKKNIQSSIEPILSHTLMPHTKYVQGKYLYLQYQVNKNDFALEN